MAGKNEGLRLALFESDPDYFDTLTKVLNEYGHSVVGLAVDMLSAERLAGRLGELDTKAALVGGLTRGFADDRQSAEVVLWIRQKFPRVVTIGMPDSGKIEGAYYNFPKQDGPMALLAILDGLASEQRK